MEKIALITDSTCDLEKETIKKYNMHVLPLRIIYTDREYKDRVDISAEYVYENLKKEIPTTSLPSVQEMYEIYDRLKEEEYTHVIAVTLSSGISGLYNALRMVSEDYPDIKSFIFDSKSISLGEGLIIEEAGKMMDKGMSFNEIVEVIPKIRDTLKVFFALDTLEYLKKGGRIGHIAGTIGEILRIKPILKIENDGKYYMHDKVRGRKQSLKKLVELGKKMIDEDANVILMDGYAKKEANKMYLELKEYSENKKLGTVQLYGSISPVAGVHTGPGLIGIGCYKNVYR